ncbi:MAG: T9SS type A sorting domain-containing protein [Bacteroidota bacterium]
MRPILWLLFGLFLTISNTIQAQCIVHQTADPHFRPAVFSAFQKTHAKQRNQDIIQLGITIHIVETVAGFANIELRTLYQELDAINRYFRPAGFEFFFYGAPRFLQGRDIYTYNQAEREIHNSNRVPNTINIYYLDEIGDQQLSQFAGGISTFPWDGDLSTRFIIMQKASSNGNGGILAHELGHFFGLWHTHTPFNGLELVDRSNCASAGDLVCDTPADPNLGATGTNGCNYEGNFVDPNGDAYNPDPSNIMSYAPNFCLRRFSGGQNDRMNFYYQTTDLNEITQDTEAFPDFAIASDVDRLNISSGQIVDITYTFDNQRVTEDQEIELFWQLEQEGEITLTIQKDTLLLTAGSESFTENFRVNIPISKGTGEYTLTAVLDPNSRVLEQDKRNNFYSTELIINNDQFEDFLLFPNPVDEKLKVFARDRRKGGDILLQVVDHLGRIYLEEARFKNDDEFFAEMNVSSLQPGVYFINLVFERDDESRPFMFIKK